MQAIEQKKAKVRLYMKYAEQQGALTYNTTKSADDESVPLD